MSSMSEAVAGIPSESLVYVQKLSDIARLLNATAHLKSRTVGWSFGIRSRVRN